ncbi:hypothetical protein Esti_003473 [Eimeria stiedai]
MTEWGSDAAVPVSSEAAASGCDGTEPAPDSDFAVSSSSSSIFGAQTPTQRPRTRSALAAVPQQQQQQRSQRGGMSRRSRAGPLSSSASSSSSSAQHYQQQQQAASSSGNRGRGETAAAAAESWERRFATFRVRCRWTLILVMLFFLVLAAGHSYCMLLVLSLIVAIYKEIIQAKERREEESLPDFHLLKWYWFLVTIVGIGLPWSLQRLRGADPAWIEWVQSFHSLGFYVAWFLGFIWFILSLRKSFLRYQFSQLGVMLVVLLFVVSQSLIQIANIYSGLIWFFLPTSLVIVNDIFAYLCGTAFGRTRLIRLSPKKTVEGYVGAAVVTLLWAWVVGRQLERYPMFVCPQPYISFEPFSVFRDLSCTPSPVFVPRCLDTSLRRLGLVPWTASSAAAAAAAEGDPQQQQQQLLLQQQQQQQHILDLLREHQTLMAEAAAAEEQLLLLQAQRQQQQQQQLQQQQQDEEEEYGLRQTQQRLWLRLKEVETERTTAEASLRESCRFLFASPFDLHAMVLGSFAAFFAPFGGFFASGFKRAMRIKDFGYFIPGHGGVTDRFDCQVVMGLFTFLYQKTFVPQIGEAEAAARRTAQQQQLHLLLQQHQQNQQEQVRPPSQCSTDDASSSKSSSSRSSSSRSSSSSKSASERNRRHAGREEGEPQALGSDGLHSQQQQQQQQVAAGIDPEVAALVRAASGLSLQQLKTLKDNLEALAAGRAG